MFVFLGSAAIDRFHEVLLGFALVLYAAAYGILFGSDDDDDEVYLL